MVTGTNEVHEQTQRFFIRKGRTQIGHSPFAADSSASFCVSSLDFGYHIHEMNRLLLAFYTFALIGNEWSQLCNNFLMLCNCFPGLLSKQMCLI